MTHYLQFCSLEKRYGRVTALAGVDLTIGEGTVLALLGPNGAGKSTLFGCLLGFTRPSAGSIAFRGRRMMDLDRRRFGYVSERVALYPHRTVEDNCAFFARLRGHAPGEVVRQLGRVGLLALRDRKVRQLSKGMLQRLGLAIALCGGPELLVLDEPFNGLDPALLDDLRALLKEEQQRGATLLISTHTMSAVEPLATHVAILLHGRLAASATLAELRRQQDPEDSLESIYHRIARREHAQVQEALCA